MSASLVGSEMCIRDRTRPSRTTRCMPSAKAEASGLYPAPLNYEWPESVSYTHLTLPTICSV
eukprot:10876680-Alexandrium_andersonii.AAC.1